MLLGDARGSPKSVHTFLGTLQWTCLLNRPLLSTLGCVYEFVERVPYNFIQSVPCAVMDELCLCVSLFCCLNVDLARPWAPEVVASDGALAYGFGMARASCSEEWVRHIAAHCAEEGHGIIPKGVNLDTDSVKAVLAPLHIPMHYDEFVPQFSVKAKAPGNAPTMEAIAVTLTWRRITRSMRSHSRRWVCLLDAMALLYALRKGRSSSAAFKVQLQKVAALLLCADISATYGYTPTSCNPGDPPSLGVRRTLEHKRQRKDFDCPWFAEVRSVRRAFRHFRAAPIKCLPCALLRKRSFDSMSSDSLTVQPESRL